MRIKDADIANKIIVLQCSWIRVLYDIFVHEWKLIPPYLSEKSFSTSFKYHSNLPFRSNKAKFFLSFLKENYFELQKKNLAMMTEIPTCILSQFLWCNKSIQVEKGSVQLLLLFKKNYQLPFGTF